MQPLTLALVQRAWSVLIPGKVFWPYFAGAVVLIVGLAKTNRTEVLRAQGLERAIVFGPLLFAVPMAVFGADHFIFPTVTATLVPSWIPAHLFWVYFVGVALLAAALSIATKVHSILAATLLSAMILSFDLLIHIPYFAAHAGDRRIFTIVLRELSFSAGALAYALVQSKDWPESRVKNITILVRYALAVPAMVFGVEHFLHPELVPVVPLRQVMPSWIPAHWFLAYVSGAVLVACGLSMILHWRARLAATSLGIYVFVVVLLVYLPITIAKITDLGNGLNYLADTLAFGGSALLLAAALPSTDHSEVPSAMQLEPASRVNVQEGDMT